MFPSASGSHPVSCTLRDSEHFSDCIRTDARREKPTNGIGLFICQFSVMVLFAVCSRQPTFANTISHVVRDITEKQMVGINTSGIITMMQNLHSPWNRSPVQFPRDSVRANVFVVDFQSAIAPTGMRCPNPAGGSLFHFSKEAFTNGIHKSIIP
jgi:hypothetical protein